MTSLRHQRSLDESGFIEWNQTPLTSAQLRQNVDQPPSAIVIIGNREDHSPYSRPSIQYDWNREDYIPHHKSVSHQTVPIQGQKMEG